MAVFNFANALLSVAFAKSLLALGAGDAEPLCVKRKIWMSVYE